VLFSANLQSIMVSLIKRTPLISIANLPPDSSKVVNLPCENTNVKLTANKAWHSPHGYVQSDRIYSFSAFLSLTLVGDIERHVKASCNLSILQCIFSCSTFATL
jgi:hypothetical protein